MRICSRFAHEFGTFTGHEQKRKACEIARNLVILCASFRRRPHYTHAEVTRINDQSNAASHAL